MTTCTPILCDIYFVTVILCAVSAGAGLPSLHLMGFPQGQAGEGRERQRLCHKRGKDHSSAAVHRVYIIGALLGQGEVSKSVSCPLALHKIYSSTPL